MAKTQTGSQPPAERAASIPQLARPRRRFNWGIVLVPGACLLAAWVLNHVEPAITWRDILSLVNVRPQHYSRLAILGLTLIGFLAVKKILQSGRKR